MANIDRLARCFPHVEERLNGDFRGHLAALVIPHCGHIVEASASQGAKLPNDPGVTEQVTVVRRLLLLLKLLGRLGPLADQVLVLCFPGNHDEARTDRFTTPDDAWPIDAVSAVQDALESRASTSTSPSSTPTQSSCRCQ